MKKLFSIFLFCLALGSSFFLRPAWANEVDDLTNRINEYQSKIDELQKQKNTLSQQIALLDNQISVTSLRISQSQVQIKNLEGEIEALSGKIVRLDSSLNSLSKVLLTRITETYKEGRSDPLLLLISSRSFSGFISRYRYLQTVQLHDREMLLAMEQTRTSYDEQKQLKEKKQSELEELNKKLAVQKVQLNSQVVSRKKLLEETKGQEANYQKLLAEARAELEAILGILAGQGKEAEARKVSEGEKIASIIAGASCNSSGTHLHFMVTKDSKALNPFSYLKTVDYQNCSGSICDSKDGDTFNPSGSWSWPVNPKIKLTQGYGYTWAVQHFSWLRKIYDFHNGIDLQGANLEVKAVKAGTLFLGSYSGHCTLRYVRVHHDEDGLDSIYLHVNY